MSSLPPNTNASLPGSTGAAVVPGVSANTPAGAVAPPVPGAVTGGGAATTGDDAQVLATLNSIIAVLKQIAALQGASLGAAGVQGGGAATPGAVPVGGAFFPPTVMGSFTALGATTMSANAFGGAAGSTVGGVMLSPSTGTTTSLANGTPAFLPSIGDVTGGGGSFTTPQAGASFAPTTFGSFSAIGASTPMSTTASFGTATSTIGGTVLSASAATAPGNGVAGVSGGGAAAAPAAQPVVDMRRVLGSPRAGDVIDTILKSASVMAGASKSEGAYITLTDANGAQMQVHAHGAWSSHPTRILEGLQRGFIQAHLHEDGTVHLHDVV